jgi:two-component system chemotaxis sensor kinase CheA
MEPVRSEPAPNVLPTELSNSLTEDERWHLHAALAEGASLFVVYTSFDVQDFEEPFRNLQERLKSQGEIISSSPTISPEQPTRINFRILYVSKIDAANLSGEFDRPPEVSLNLVIKPEGIRSQPVRIAAKPHGNLIHVELSDLDELAASAHNLFVQTRTSLEELTARPNEEAVTQSVELMRRRFMSLEKQIIGLRMVPIERTLLRAIRAGRTAARTAGKKIDFEVSGTEILMDKLLVNAISDPLIHLIRNAVDHGIEKEEERLDRGKPPRGQVKLEVTSDGGQYVVTVSDDGRGVNPEGIAQAAVTQGIIADGAAVDLEQSLRLIFRPGFSSKDSPSGVSGRGVGLDVVETAIEHAGGEVRVSSDVGQGTVFEIILPVTFGLLQSTVVRSEAQSYCLDAGLINRSQEIRRSQIETIDELLWLKMENESWPLLYLRSLLGQSPLQIPTDDPLHLLLCEFRQQPPDQGKRMPRRVGLIVDALEGPEEVLVRGLGSHGGRWHGVAGATELRDGRVALVLDLPRLLRPG